jgi:hypothetical protein
MPESNILALWNIVILFLVLFESVNAPLEFSFDGYTSVDQGLQQFVLVMFVVDMYEKRILLVESQLLMMHRADVCECVGAFSL